MTGQVIKATLLSLGGGYLCQLAQEWLGTDYFGTFLKNNMINLLVALLAVNSATMGIVLTKIRDLVEKHGHGDKFRQTRAQCLLSVKEQIVLIAASIILLTVQDSSYFQHIGHVPLLLKASLTAIFIYAMLILYDTAKSVLIIVDYETDKEA